MNVAPAAGHRNRAPQEGCQEGGGGAPATTRIEEGGGYGRTVHVFTPTKTTTTTTTGTISLKVDTANESASGEDATTVVTAAFSDEASSSSSSSPALFRRVASSDSSPTFTATSSSSSSTSPPRFVLHPANHVLSGRGQHANLHPGNLRFRRLVARFKPKYDQADKLGKGFVARKLIKAWRYGQHPAGRFVKLVDQPNNLWCDETPEQVEKKLKQLFRDTKVVGNAGADDIAGDDNDVAEHLEPNSLTLSAFEEEFSPEEAILLEQIFRADRDNATDGEVQPGAGTAATARAGAVPPPRIVLDCVLGPLGHSTEIRGTRHFWEWVDKARGTYHAGSGSEKLAMAQGFTREFVSKGGRFLRQVKVDKSLSWIVADEDDAVTMVHYFMGHEWVITPNDDWDFMLGRGTETNNHYGNDRFRKRMDDVKLTYIKCRSSERKAVAKSVIADWRGEGGRFLGSRDESLGLRRLADDPAVLAMVQRYLCRGKDLYLAQQQPQQQQPVPVPVPVLSPSLPSQPYEEKVIVSLNPTNDVICGRGGEANHQSPVVSVSFHGPVPPLPYTQGANAAYMSSHFSGGLMSSSLGSSMSSLPPAAPKGRIIASFVGRAKRLLAPLLCLFGRGRDRHHQGL